MSHGINGIDLRYEGCEPTDLEQAYLVSVIQILGTHVPDLERHVTSITIKPKREYPAKAAMILNDDEMFMLQFVNAGGKYWWPLSVDASGEIELDYTPYVDFLTALLLHEMAHVMQRAKDPEALMRARMTRTRMDKHHLAWSKDAVALYQIFGCEKAALFCDGMSYPSTRSRHTKLVPSERAWLYHVWSSFDNQTFGTLRPEFERLFIPHQGGKHGPDE